MQRALLGSLLVALTSGVLSACSSGGDSDAAGPQATDTVTTTAEPDPLTLTADTTEAVHCWREQAPRDLAWYEVQWQANVDLDEFSFEILGAEGVTQVGPAKTVPPVNFGGRINTGGTITWEAHRKVLRRDNFVLGINLDSAAFWSPIAGETGLLVFHLRLDHDVLPTQQGGRFEGVKARYTTADGQQGETRVETEQIFRVGRCR